MDVLGHSIGWIACIHVSTDGGLRVADYDFTCPFVVAFGSNGIVSLLSDRVPSITRPAARRGPLVLFSSLLYRFRRERKECQCKMNRCADGMEQNGVATTADAKRSLLTGG
jgi:hypothetical protein